jgi:hypothetical protein
LTVEAITKRDDDAALELIQDPQCNLNRAEAGVTPLLVAVYLGIHLEVSIH